MIFKIFFDEILDVYLNGFNLPYPFSKIVLQTTSFTPKFDAFSTENSDKFHAPILTAGNSPFLKVNLWNNGLGE